jgi:hypothetical protein
MSVSLDDHPHISQMAFDCLLAGTDDGFETKWLASWVPSRVGFAYRKLTDGPAQKIESHLPLVLLECVSNARFTGL